MVLNDLDNIAYNKFANGEITLTEYIEYKNSDKIMNYEEKYKEALKKVKELLKDQEIALHAREKLANVFPELKDPKESEDERIRKEIIYFLSRNTFQFGEDIDKYKSWIAWLEKQDNKPVNIDIESMVSSYKQRLKSQGGVENSPLVNMCLTAFRHGVENALEELNLKELEKQGEQKPSAWSKEDEARIKQLLGWLDTLKNYIHYDALVSLELRRERIDKVSKLESWLKSLKQRLGQGLNPNEAIEWLKPYVCGVDDTVKQFKKDFKL